MLPKHLAIAASRAIVQSLMQSNLMILLRIGTIRLLGLRLGPLSLVPTAERFLVYQEVAMPSSWPIGHCDQRKPNRAFSDFK